MKRAEFDGTTLAYEEVGSGEPVVLIHGALIADTFHTVMPEPALKDFRLIRYHRQGHGESSKPDGLLPVAKQANDCVALLRSLDALPAHVVGHSGGGIIAIQIALEAPDAVRTLTLLEPALIDVPSGAALFATMGSVLQAYQAGDKAGAVDGFIRAVCGEGYRTALDAALPGAFEQAVADADTFFASEFPAMPSWSFMREDAAQITQPVLAVTGANSDAVSQAPIYNEIQARVLDWFPDARPFILPRAAHLLQVENPHDLAEALAAFLTSVQEKAAA